jgi:hypothetical protein
MRCEEERKIGWLTSAEHVGLINWRIIAGQVCVQRNNDNENFFAAAEKLR